MAPEGARRVHLHLLSESVRVIPSPSELFRVRPSSFESVRIHPSRPQTQAHWSGPARPVAGGWPGLDGLDGLRAAAVPGKQAIPVTIRPADPRRQQSQ